MLGLSIKRPGLAKIPHFMIYHGARIAVYGILGAAAGGLGSLFGFGPGLNRIASWISIALGTGIIAIGLGYLGWMPLGRLRGSGAWLTRGMSQAIARKGYKGMVLLGALNGLLPCGLVYSSLLILASSGSALSGALGMLVFGAGTLPSLLVIGLGAGALSAKTKAGPCLWSRLFDHNHRRSALSSRRGGPRRPSFHACGGFCPMVAVKEHCALCGLEIHGSPVLQNFGGEEKHFCCQGCARIYQVAHENNMLDQVLTQPKRKPMKFADLRFKPGETAYFSIRGMWCAGCAVAAEHVLKQQAGIKNVDVSFAAERGRIQYDPAVADPNAILRSLSGLGYQSNLLSDVSDQSAERGREHTLYQLLTALAFGMQVMFFYLEQLYPLYAAGKSGTPDVRRLHFIVWMLTTPVFFYGGYSFLLGAWRALKARTATMDTLVAMGTLSAYCYSVYVTLSGKGLVYFDSVAMITTFVMIGRYLETLGGDAARKGIRKLLSLQPSEAWLNVGGVWREVPSDTLKIGDAILIKPGQRVPADAEIQEGQAAIDESLLTGESTPVGKNPGDIVFAGTLVTDGALTCEVRQLSHDTRLARITQLVERTLAAKPPIQRLADKASAYFTFGIVGISILTFLGWSGTGHDIARSLLAAVAVLVVACPCALGLATPFALTITLGRATETGILVRNPASLETAAKVSCMAFDKTGTLTRGALAVTSVEVNPGMGLKSEELLRLAASVEQFSEHPLAKAIVAACPVPLAAAGEFQSLRGMGASARVGGQDGRRVMVGSLRFLGEEGCGELAALAQARSERGESVIWIGWDGAKAGFIALRDAPNPSAKAALSRLRQAGIRLVMLSGDNPRTTGAIAAELGLKEFEGDCTPADKLKHIQTWQTEGERVGMIGDGINDAPALAQADLSATIVGGTDVAGETSDVMLMRPDLELIPWFIHLCHRTQRVIAQNLAWAFAYNLVVLPMAAFGIISPVIASVTMATSSILVVGNSLRLRIRKR